MFIYDFFNIYSIYMYYGINNIIYVLIYMYIKNGYNF